MSLPDVADTNLLSFSFVPRTQVFRNTVCTILHSPTCRARTHNSRGWRETEREREFKLYGFKHTHAHYRRQWYLIIICVKRISIFYKVDINGFYIFWLFYFASMMCDSHLSWCFFLSLFLSRLEIFASADQANK